MVDIFVVEEQDTCVCVCVCAEWTAEVRIRKRGQASEDGGPVDYIAIPFFLSFLPSLSIPLIETSSYRSAYRGRR